MTALSPQQRHELDVVAEDDVEVVGAGPMEHGPPSTGARQARARLT